METERLPTSDFSAISLPGALCEQWTPVTQANRVLTPACLFNHIPVVTADDGVFTFSSAHAGPGHRPGSRPGEYPLSNDTRIGGVCSTVTTRHLDALGTAGVRGLQCPLDVCACVALSYEKVAEDIGCPSE